MNIYSNYKKRPKLVETEVSDEILAEQIGYRSTAMIAKEMIDAGLNLKAQRMGITREMLDDDDELIYTPIYEMDPTDLTERVREYYERLDEKIKTFTKMQSETDKTTTQTAQTETTLKGGSTEPIETASKGD